MGRKAPLDEKSAQRFFRDIISGVDYLHSNRIAHRDLKLDNFLVNDSWRVLITDYGFSVLKPGSSLTRLGHKNKALLVEFEPLFLATICGTPDYMAPELYAIAIEQKRYESENVYCYSLYAHTNNPVSFEGGSIRSNQIQVRWKSGGYLCGGSVSF